MRQRTRTIVFGLVAVALVLAGAGLMWLWSQYQHFRNDHTQLHYAIFVINELGRRDPALIPTALQAAGLQLTDPESVEVGPPAPP